MVAVNFGLGLYRRTAAIGLRAELYNRYWFLLLATRFGHSEITNRLPDKQQVYQTIEGTITHFELIMKNRGFEVPCEESYAAIEAPNGELGFYLVGDGSHVAYRARCRPPSLIHFAIFPYLIRGHTLSDVVAVLGSLNVIAAELDR